MACSRLSGVLGRCPFGPLALCSGSVGASSWVPGAVGCMLTVEEKEREVRQVGTGLSTRRWGGSSSVVSYLLGNCQLLQLSKSVSGHSFHLCILRG